MTAYFDTSVITKWYLPEPDSAGALRVRARFAPPAVLTHLHGVVLVTAWHLKVFRREIPREIVEQVWAMCRPMSPPDCGSCLLCDLVHVYAEVLNGSSSSDC